ncbi:MAG: flagellar biosynthetic protein FliO [Oligoflexales bacterium]
MLKSVLMSCLLLAYSPVFAKEETGAKKVAPTILKALEVENVDSNTVVNLKFDQKIKQEKPSLEDHGSFIQMILSDVTVLESGKFYESTSPYINKVAVVQGTENRALIRIFLARDAAALLPSFKVDVLEDRLLVFLDHKSLEARNIKDHLKTEAKDQASEIVASTPVKNDIPDPAKLTFGKPVDNRYSDKMVLVAGFLVVLLLLAGASFILRNFFRKLSGKNASYDVPKFKTLATYAIAPKQRLAVVEIGGQQILLGISQQNISYLTTISDKAPRQVLEPMSRPEVGKNTWQLPSKVATQKYAANEVERSAIETPKPVERKVSRKKQTERVQSDDISRSIEDVTNLIRSKIKDLPAL